jgi:hypothetical protein
MNLNAVFEKFNGEHSKFERVENKLHSRPDLCAFLLLDKLLPNDGKDMVCASAYDEIYLDADCQKLAKVATEDDILTLARCGVWYDIETNGLALFV